MKLVKAILAISAITFLVACGQQQTVEKTTTQEDVKTSVEAPKEPVVEVKTETGTQVPMEETKAPETPTEAVATSDIPDKSEEVEKESVEIKIETDKK